MSRLLTALLVVFLARPDALPGQAASLPPGARVRITQAGEQRIAVVVSRSSDTLIVRGPELANTFAVPLADVSRLEVSTGRHRHVLRSAGMGTLIAGVGGAVLGAATYTPCESTEFLGCLMAPTSAAESALMGGVAGGVLGLVVGALVGLPAREGWQQVSLDARRVAVGVTPRAGSTSLGVTVRF